MVTDGTDRAAGWIKYAGHKWPIDRVELREGVVRFCISGMATHNVPAGTTTGELYGSDGALVFRAPEMEHTDIHAGEVGSMSINFFLPRFDDEDAEPTEDELNVEIAAFMAEQDQDVPPSMGKLLLRARQRWVFWRKYTFIVGTLGAVLAMGQANAPWWTVLPVEVGGFVVAMRFERFFDREWWNK